MPDGGTGPKSTASGKVSRQYGLQKRVLQYMERRPHQNVYTDVMAQEFGAASNSVQNAISALMRKGQPITVIARGQIYAYAPPQRRTASAAAAAPATPSTPPARSGTTVHRSFKLVARTASGTELLQDAEGKVYRLVEVE